MDSITVSVSALSGQEAQITLDWLATVGELRRQASERLGGAFRQGLKLAYGEHVLMTHQSLEAAGLKEGACVSAVPFRPMIAANNKAFAYIRGDQSVVTWGCDQEGGDSDAVRAQLQDVRAIKASQSAFAAIRNDGTVVTWGSPGHGGDSSRVQPLRRVECIQASHRCFAALTTEGRAISWGAKPPPGHREDREALPPQCILGPRS